MLITRLWNLEMYKDTRRAGGLSYLPFFLSGSRGNYFCVHDCVINSSSLVRNLHLFVVDT